MNSEELLKEIYKPLRVTIQGKVKIFDTTEGKFVVKEKGKANIRDVYSYLNSRNFSYFPKIVDDTRSGVNIYEYVEDSPTPKNQKAHDMIRLVALLHNKTSYFKEVSLDTYQEIYENIKSNTTFLREYYNSLFDEFLLEEFMSPSKYLFTRNYTTISDALSFCDKELDEWFDLVKEESKQRVALLHNKLELSHYIKGDNDYLVSWDDSTIDTPVWDIVKFYKKEYYDLEFSSILKEYLDDYKLNKDELKLLFILLVLPDKIEFGNNEYHNTNIVRNFLDYLFKTEELIRPYYAEEKKE